MTVEVTLANGSRFDLGQLDKDELWRLQFDQERAFARQILEAGKGSAARRRKIKQAYDTVCTIQTEMLQEADALVMGHSPRYTRLVLELLSRRRGVQRPKPRLFEIGYGSGPLLSQVAKAGFAVSGIEISSTMRDQATRLIPREYHAQLLLGDLLETGLLEQVEGGDESPDVVFWNDVLEHIPPDEVHDYLVTARRLLRPGGCLVTITPNWHVRPSDVTGDFRAPRTESEGLHLKEYTLREVTAMLRQAGFRQVALPMLAIPSRAVLLGGGLGNLKRGLEPWLEYLPFRITKLLVRGLTLDHTIATT